MLDIKKILTKILTRLHTNTVVTVNNTSAAKSIGANAAGYIDVTITVPSGYELIGIIQLFSYASAAVPTTWPVPTTWQITSSTNVRVYYRNITGSSVSQTVSVTALCRLVV